MAGLDEGLDAAAFENLARKTSEDVCAAVEKELKQMVKKLDSTARQTAINKRDIRILKDEVDELKNVNKRNTIILNGVTEKPENARSKENVKALVVTIAKTRMENFKKEHILYRVLSD